MKPLALIAVVLAWLATGCIDDFSHPDGYGEGGSGGGGTGGRSGNSAASCNSLCERTKRCPDTSIPGDDCAAYCTKLDNLFRNAGCTDEFDDLLSCSARLPDVCNSPEDACRSESVAFSDCFTVYCADHAQECSDALQ